MAGSNPASHVHAVEGGSIPFLIRNVGFSRHDDFSFSCSIFLLVIPEKCVGVPGKVTVQSSSL